ncbi:hypothetical protein [Flavobacterium sp.]|uniref:hypothetical protein n=1 Tax=Flavobacterium sp. TaxID=239 RepID=UPI003751497E
MTTKQPHQYLGLTQDEYDTDCMIQYMRWCQNMAKAHNVPLQSLLANRGMSNYYTAQFLELEHSFKIIAARLDGLVDTEIMNRNYEMIMVELYCNYPSALIEAAKRLKIENPTFNQN